MKKINIIGGFVVILALITLFIAVHMTAYKQGINKASLSYEKQLSDQKTQYINDKEQLEQQLNEVNKQVAESVANVHQLFVPVEKEIIKYVSRDKESNSDGKCGVDVARWMQLHNLAASPYDVPYSAKFNDSTAQAVRAN